jgi:flagellar hook assembly protein FlgD
VYFSSGAGVAGDPGNHLPFSWELNPCYPNPTTGRTVFKFTLQAPARATLEVFNVLGQRVGIIVNGKLAAGQHSVNWNGADKNGNRIACGVYLYQLRVEGKAMTKRMMILR